MKQIKIVKTKTAVIILSIVVLLLIIAVFNFFDKVYQKPSETFPEISVYYKDKEIGKMFPIKYEWKYKGDTKSFQMEELDNYNYPEENVALVDSVTLDNSYVMKANFRYKTIGVAENIYARKFNSSMETNTNRGEWSKLLSGKGMGIQNPNGVGEFIYRVNVQYMQGTVSYVIKLVSFEHDQAEIAKNYLNTKLTENEKIEELLSKIKFGTMLNSLKIEGNNVTIEYAAHISDESVKMNNLILFTCIPELEKITYSPKNKKTFTYDNVDERVEIDSVEYTREQVDGEDLANIENLKKFMEQI